MHLPDIHEETNQDEGLSSGLEDIIPILKKSFEERTKRDTRLVTSLLEQVPYFNKYCSLYKNSAEEDKYLSQVLKEAKKKEALSNLSKYVKYSYYPEGSAICHHGDPAEKFFVVLKGEVRRYIPRRFNDIQKELKSRQNFTPQTKKTYNSNPSTENDINESRSTEYPGSLNSVQGTPDGNVIEIKTSSLESLDEEIEQREDPESLKTFAKVSSEEIRVFRRFKMDKKYFLSDILTMKFNKSFMEGDYIGEMSLTFNMANTDTLVSWTDTHLMTIEKHHFEEIFDTLIRQNREKLDFATEIFPDLPKNEITTFAYGFEQIRFPSPSTVFLSGTTADGLYFVKEGEIELYTNLSPEKTGNSMMNLRRTQNKLQKLSLLIISRGKLIGEEMLLGHEKRTYSAITRTYNTVVYFVPQKHLAKMEFYRLNVLKHLTTVAESLYQAKMKLLENAVNQNKLKKDYINKISDKAKEEERDNIGEAISEMTNKTIQDDKEAVKRTGLIRLKKPRVQLQLKEEDYEAIQQLIEIKKQTNHLKGNYGSKIFPIKEKNQQRSEKGITGKEESNFSETKSNRNSVANTGAPLKKDSEIQYISLWEQARKNHVSRKHKFTLGNHSSNSGSNIESERSSTRFSSVAPSIKNLAKFFPTLNLEISSSIKLNSEGDVGRRDNSTPSREEFIRILNLNQDSTPKLGANTPVNNRVQFKFQLPPLDSSFDVPFCHSISPIRIQGLVGLRKNEQKACRIKSIIPNSTREAAIQTTEKLGTERKSVLSKGEGQSESTLDNLENKMVDKPFNLPALKPQKVLTSRIPQNDIKLLKGKKLYGLFSRKLVV